MFPFDDVIMDVWKSNFYNGEVQQDSFECLLFLLNIMDNGSVPYFIDEHMATGILYLNSIWQKYIVRDVHSPKTA